MKKAKVISNKCGTHGFKIGAVVDIIAESNGVYACQRGKVLWAICAEEVEVILS